VTSTRGTRSIPASLGGLDNLGRTREEGCLVQFAIDGLRVTGFGDTEAFDVNHVRAANVESIDVYLNTMNVPLGFQPRDAACGIVVIWTRPRPTLER
jgi:hypothetical protein